MIGGQIMKKKIGIILTTAVLVFSMLFAAGCSNSTTSQQTQKFKIKVAALKGPTGIGMVKLMEDNKSDYDISIYNSPDQIVSKLSVVR